MLMIYFRVIFASKFHMEIFKIFSNLEISRVEYRLIDYRDLDFKENLGFEKKFRMNIIKIIISFMVDIK